MLCTTLSRLLSGTTQLRSPVNSEVRNPRRYGWDNAQPGHGGVSPIIVIYNDYSRDTVWADERLVLLRSHVYRTQTLAAGSLPVCPAPYHNLFWTLLIIEKGRKRHVCHPLSSVATCYNTHACTHS